MVAKVCAEPAPAGARGSTRILKVARPSPIFRGVARRGFDSDIPCPRRGQGCSWVPLWGLQEAKNGIRWARRANRFPCLTLSPRRGGAEGGGSRVISILQPNLSHKTSVGFPGRYRCSPTLGALSFRRGPRNREKVSQTLGQAPRAASRLAQTALAQAVIAVCSCASVAILVTPPPPPAPLRSCERASWTGQGHVQLCDTPFLPWAAGACMKGVVFKGASPARTKGAVSLPLSPILLLPPLR